jgi:hypothetical protein
MQDFYEDMLDYNIKPTEAILNVMIQGLKNAIEYSHDQIKEYEAEKLELNKQDVVADANVVTQKPAVTGKAAPAAPAAAPTADKAAPKKKK